MPSYQSDLMATPAKRVIRGFESLTRFQDFVVAEWTTALK